MSAAKAAATLDQRALVIILSTFINVNSYSFVDPGKAAYVYDSIGSKLSANGVTGWLAHFVALSDSEAESMLGPSNKREHTAGNLLLLSLHLN